MPGSGPELMSARETIKANLANLPLTVLRKILSDNAQARLPSGAQREPRRSVTRDARSQIFETGS